MDDDQNTSDEEDAKKHEQADKISPASSDTASALGSASEAETMDIDEAEAAFGKETDENGPRELGEN